MGLARALEKLGGYSKRIPMRNVQPSTAHLYIAQPFMGGGFSSLFSTHPKIDDRIRRLMGR